MAFLSRRPSPAGLELGHSTKNHYLNLPPEDGSIFPENEAITAQSDNTKECHLLEKDFLEKKPFPYRGTRLSNTSQII